MSSEYPRWFKSKDLDIIVKFYDLKCGVVIEQGSSNFLRGYFDTGWASHTDKVWEEVTHLYKDQTPKCKHDTPLDSECKECQEEVNKTFWQALLDEKCEEGHNNGGSTDYYKFNQNWKECQDVIEAKEMNFAQGNIFKASFCFNQGRHDATTYERELNKIIYFAKRELERIKNA